MTDSNFGKWAPWYQGDVTQDRYGNDDVAYELGAAWLSGLVVEDWGCGRGWFRRFHPAELYTGIDGTPSPWADKVADLALHRSSPEGIFLRGVIEHNPQWADVLANALASARHRIFLAVFTPDGAGEELDRIAELDVPDLALSTADITAQIVEAGWSVSIFDVVPTATYYGSERCWWLER